MSSGLWRQTLANEAPMDWDPRRYVPAGLVVHLGTNDFCPRYHPEMSRTRFEAAYAELLSDFARLYPGIETFAACGPMGTPGYFPCEVFDRVAVLASRRGIRVSKLD